MGVRSGSREMQQRDRNEGGGNGNSGGSSGGLVSSLMKSWRISSSSSHSSQARSSGGRTSNMSTPAHINSSDMADTENNGNFDAMIRQQIPTGHTSQSPLRYSSTSESPKPSMFHSRSHHQHSHHKHLHHHHHYNPNNSSNNNTSINSNYIEGSTGGSSSHKRTDKVFQDLDEDWSAVIDDYNMPIPMIANGGIAAGVGDSGTCTSTSSLNNDFSIPITPKVTNQEILSNTPSSVGNYMPGGTPLRTLSNSIHPTLSGSVTNFTYPQLPQFGHALNGPDFNSSHSLVTTTTADRKSHKELENERDIEKVNSIVNRMAKFDAIIKDKHIINLQDLREISWNGVPKPQRATVWKLLVGYLPVNTRRQQPLLNRKRKEYSDGLKHTFSNDHSRDEPTWHQIEIDIPRTNPHITLYQFKSVQKSLQRILYLWAIRHPASGYVQGINDIVTPFFQTFLTEYLSVSQIDDVEKLDPETYMTSDQINNLEADTFWCLTKVLEQITDNYIHGQPGILKQVKNLSQLVKRIDSKLYKHFQNEHVEFIQFAFRWMNCLLMREFQMKAVIRMWDTYLAETSIDTSTNTSASLTLTTSNNINNNNNLNGNGSNDFPPHTPTQISAPTLGSPSVDFSSPNARKASSGNTATDMKRQRHTSLNEFHVFVCAAFLIKWSEKLIRMDFQSIITFLQNPPTKDWSETDIEMLLGEAYIWQSLYKDATSHWL
ncbi:hypothetical protein TBLA_0E00900 [Henningerozyma blattae CBS 6284]|uniref:Rab-GAP TBC domain-containing protein n=1 Tax=Henningerozyma blattae (strain ATCC 34711 / CBS 6284 / DSM 70876 / NBRC 10599 / NRRL Y-10934 / UCD 77-7) TaxID=1071380 RepID=I2H449_HENB6|nr:hypothetical protein TBLA_0E00900 [Tetrapisispora blattae CBS 6284]CCH61151.1 hypothetical protein TBLA_0E00900 [Tetrapisispora blattae CBS 6284]